MKKKLIPLVVFVGAMSFSMAVVNLQSDKVNLNYLKLSMVEALSNNETEWGCGGNPTYVKHQSLKSDICLSGGTHLKCKKETDVCCDPSRQTDCPPIKI